MTILTRRQALAGLAATGALAFGGRPLSAQSLDQFTINAMPATPSVVVAHLVENNALSAHVAKATLKVWRTPDQMRAGVLSGDMKVFGTPSYSCANMMNRGVPVRLMNIMTWGLLYLMTRGPEIRSVSDLAGKDVVLAFRNDAPDLIFRLVLRRAGLDPEKDLKLHYVGTPTEASQLFLAGKTEIAVLPEPASSAVILRGMQAGISVERAIDLTEAYGKLTGRAPRIAQAGLGVSEDLVQSRPELVKAIHEACVASARWVLNNPASAGRLGADYLDLQPAIIERSLPWFRLNITSAAEARPELEAYFNDLMEMSPDIVGGRLPDDRFYWGA
ncbi:ABC transporter substrate-binding protein [Magnetospirillum aberrantis]|uniref:ABC transporter substrate-binding protein n=1 Tax=Magnetospirillum aberrantis SpK TaxID=908842 RepID=A0A7C9QTC1_9PROT|nr:ABC transporter substrate-binding protein [Magnetospirillum aberrantis]NFV79601.1 ABC transporter substrate-binding protein [Magnetospirillum aberrantis SpK]